MSYTLGLDLGVQSVGWAIFPLDEQNGPPIRLGARCFDSGTGTESEIEQGKDESRNLKRRAARSARRNQWRRKRRTLKLFNLLRNHGLLPMGKGIHDTPLDRQALINDLDKELAAKIALNADPVSAHLLPYKLRAMALDEKLEPFALGRIFLQLSQRRGFLSNKKAEDKEGEESGTVKPAISDLNKEMCEKGFRTLGEYFASLDPEEKRIRQRWTGRQMFIDEFKAICDNQDKYYHDLLNKMVIVDSWKDNPDAWQFSINKKKRKKILSNEKFHSKKITLREAIEKALFFQRPLKSQRHLLGKCQLERGKRRAPLASLEAQRFRYWQKIIDLKYRDVDRLMISLSPEQQDNLAAALEQNEKLTYAKIRTLLGLKQPRLSKEEKDKGYKPLYAFNMEEDEDKELKGNTTSVRIAKIIPDRWNVMPDEEKERLINEILQFEHEDALAKRLEKVFKFDSNTASQLAAVQLERDYASLSKQAIRKILPAMIEKRIPFATARKEIYGEQFDEDRKEVLDSLPPVLKAVKDLKNPVVTRTLTELRKVVNAIVRKHGKPAIIRVELARDMKRSRPDREKRSKEMRQQEKRRLDAKATILKEMGAQEPRRSDILKILLAEECNWECPYTGKQITVRNLLGSAPQFDIEHTLPFSRSLDNSYTNKSLCHVDENRHVKKNQTPYEAYGHNPQRWHEILERVQRFRGPSAEIKLRRFQLKEIPDDFTNRHLSDTRYISRLAGDYLGLLFGGRIDADGKQRIQVSSGGMTSYLRDEWNLNTILGDGDEKDRTDHRHHAVDAAVIAMNEPRIIQMLSRAAEQASFEGRRLFSKGVVDPPIPDFYEKVKAAVDKINISFRASRKVSGGLHEETNYSPPKIVIEGEGKKAKEVEYRHVRTLLTKMKRNKKEKNDDVKNIVDPVIRQLVLERLAALGTDDPKKLTESDLPYLRSKDGSRLIPIRKARIRRPVATMTVGKNGRERHVAPGNNHHMEVVAVLDKNGNETKWEGVIVTMFEAYQRKHLGQSIINRDHGPGKRFKFSLGGNEYIEMKNDQGKTVLCRITTISGDNIEGRIHYDARSMMEMKKIPGARIRSSVNGLMKKETRKVFVDVLGNIHPAND